MQPAPSTSLAPPSIPAMRQLSEKPRQGFETRKTARKPGPSSCNFKVTLGLRATVVGNGVRETYSARYYNPATGRFLSRDPLDGNGYDPKSLHKYLYGVGDPVNAIDPTGRDADAVEDAELDAAEEGTITFWTKDRAVAAITAAGACALYFNDLFDADSGHANAHLQRQIAIEGMICVSAVIITAW